MTSDDKLRPDDPAPPMPAHLPVPPPAPAREPRTDKPIDDTHPHAPPRPPAEREAEIRRD